MKSLKVKTYAKINLLLNILNKRLDGYHEIETIFQTINLYDTLLLDVKKSDNIEIKIRSNSLNIPKDSSNLVYKACKLFLDSAKIKALIKVDITKNIPIEAGLGGGSSNAAGTLNALNKIFEYPFKTDALIKMSAQIGADVPFFIQGGTSIAKGIGDKLSPLNTPNLFFVIVSPKNIKISSKWAYSEYDKLLVKPLPKKISSFIDSIENNNNDILSSLLFNSFEYIIYENFKDLRHIKQQLLDLGCSGALLSGSGSSVYGIVKTQEQADNIKNIITSDNLQVYTANTISAI